MKAYTNPEQSKKLAEILPLESADMCYGIDDDTLKYNNLPWLIPYHKYTAKEFYIPCWSLAALLDVLQKTAYFIDEDANVVLSSYKTVEWNLGINNSDVELVTESNPVDACYEMIIKLHEQNFCSMKLINKSDLVLEIKRMRDKAYPQSDWNHGYVKACESIISFIDTLEVKEVDLKKEFDNYTKDILACDVQFEPFTHLYNCAKYFYELGLKTKKGE